MENVTLVIHLILAICLIGVVLLQRSEGGGLGIGGGGGGAVSGRSAATALGKLTWIFAICFIVTSILLTVFAAQNSGNSSVTDQLGIIEAPAADAPGLDATGDLLPPASTDEPLSLPRAD